MFYKSALDQNTFVLMDPAALVMDALFRIWTLKHKFAKKGGHKDTKRLHRWLMCQWITYPLLQKSISYITFSQWQYKSAFCHEYSLCRVFFFSWGYQSFLMLVCGNVVTLWSVTTPDECVLYWVAKSRLHCVKVCLKRSNVARHSANTIIVNILNRNTITKALYSSIFIVVKLKFAGYIL